MLTKVELDSQKTKVALRYVLGEILKQQPLWTGKLVEVLISETARPFPEIVQFFGENAEKEHARLADSEPQSFLEYSLSTFDLNGQAIADDENSRRFSRMEIALSCINSELSDVCVPKNQLIAVDGSPSFIALFEIKDLAKLKEKAQELGAFEYVSGIEQLQVENSLPSKNVSLPHLLTEGGIGFLIIEYEEQNKIKISKEDSKPFKLLRSLFEPALGIAKNIDTVFEALRSERDSAKTALCDTYLEKSAKETIVKDARRKIYTILKQKKVQGVLKIRIRQGRCWAEWKSK